MNINVFFYGILILFLILFFLIFVIFLYLLGNKRKFDFYSNLPFIKKTKNTSGDNSE